MDPYVNSRSSDPPVYLELRIVRDGDERHELAHALCRGIY